MHFLGLFLLFPKQYSKENWGCFAVHSVHQVYRVWCASEHSERYSEGWQYHLLSPIIPPYSREKLYMPPIYYTELVTELYGSLDGKTLLSQEGGNFKGNNYDLTFENNSNYYGLQF